MDINAAAEQIRAAGLFCDVSNPHRIFGGTTFVIQEDGPIPNLPTSMYIDRFEIAYDEGRWTVALLYAASLIIAVSRQLSESVEAVINFFQLKQLVSTSDFEYKLWTLCKESLCPRFIAPNQFELNLSQSDVTVEYYYRVIVELFEMTTRDRSILLTKLPDAWAVKVMRDGAMLLEKQCSTFDAAVDIVIGQGKPLLIQKV
ncbi:MAG: hypothetical protein KC519_18680 [Anaerolineae bacterium]|nr:hypothetical protein [Anaerolineae bacterium]